MFNNKQQGIVYLDRNIFDYYGENSTDTLRFDFSPFISNLEIINKEDLIAQINLFIDSNKLIPSNLAIVLSENVLFTKGLPEGTEHPDEEIQKFSDNIPFERVGIKSYKLNTGTLLVATNKDLFTTIKEAFNKKGFNTEAVIPIFNTGINSLDPNYGLDPASAKSLMGSFERLKQGSFEIDSPLEIIKPKEENRKKKENKRTYALLGVFGFLIIILALVTVNSLKPPPPKKTQAPRPLEAPAKTVAEPVSSSSSALLTETEMKIGIVADAGNLNAEKIKQSLITVGFANVTIDKTSSLNLSQPVVMFSSTVPETIREKILKETKIYYPSILPQESPNSALDATITLPKQ